MKSRSREWRMANGHLGTSGRISSRDLVVSTGPRVALLVRLWRGILGGRLHIECNRSPATEEGGSLDGLC